MPGLGFVLYGALLMLVAARMPDEDRWWLSLLVAVVGLLLFTVGCWLLETAE